MQRLIILATLATAALACDNAEELPPDLSGVTTTRLDATSKEVWTFLDLDDPEAADQEAGWDLKFQRQFVRVNGDAGVEVAIVEGASITEVTSAPEGPYFKDTGDDEEGQAFSQEGGFWYDYDITVHKLSPRARTYVIRSDQGALFRLEFTGYYDEDGVAGNPTFYWTTLP